MPATEVLSAPVKEGSTPQEVLKIVDSVPVVSNVFSGFVHGKPNQLRVFVGMALSSFGAENNVWSLTLPRLGLYRGTRSLSEG